MTALTTPRQRAPRSVAEGAIVHTPQGCTLQGCTLQGPASQAPESRSQDPAAPRPAASRRPFAFLRRPRTGNRANTSANTGATTSAATRATTRATTLGLTALLGLAAVAGDAAFNAAPAAAAIGIRTMDVSNLDRQRPIVHVRLIGGRWQFRTDEKVRFNLKAYVRSKRKRMTYFAFNTGRRSYEIWRGGKTWRLRSNRLRFTLNFSDFPNNFHSTVARFCGEKMRGRTGTRDFNANLTLQFYILDSRGFRANRNKSIPSIIRCIS